MSSSPPSSFYCDLCKRDDRLEPCWVHHLASVGHQRALARQPQGGCGHWGEDSVVKLRAVEVVGCHELSATAIDLAKYLTKCGGVLEEFICPTSLSGTKPNIVSCLFKELESAEKLLGSEEHKIFRQPIQIRRKYEALETPTTQEQDGPENGSVCGDKVDEGSPMKTEIENGHGLNGNHDPGTHTNIETRKRKRKHRTHENKVFPKLEDQLLDLHKSHHPQLRTKIVKDLQKVVAATFNQCGIYSYGPDYIGVCLDSDELRLCVDPYGKFTAKSILIIRNPSDPMACGLICQILSTSKDPDGSPKFTFVSQYSTSSLDDIPEISFKQSVNQVLVPCKLQFENFLSVQKSRILKFLTNHDDRVLSMFSLLRLWSKKHQVLHELREGEEFEGYILIMLMIFHLTRNKFLPSVAAMRELAGKDNPSLVLDNMDVGYCRSRRQFPPARVPSDKSLRALTIIQTLQTFFQFFAKFKFSTTVICPSIGEVLERNNFRPQMDNNLPPQILKHYKSNADGTLRETKLAIFSPVVVQDLLDLTDNVARAVDEADLSLFQSKCRKTARFLETLLNNGNGDLMKQFHIKTSEPGDETESSEDEEEDSTNEEEFPNPPSPLHFFESSASPPPAPLSDKHSSLSPPSSSSSEPPSFNAPLLPSPPPLLPPPAPFKIPGMPLIPMSTINLIPPPPPPPPRTSPFLGKRVAPPPPKIGGLLPTPRILVRDEPERYVSKYAAQCAGESETRILRDPRANEGEKGESYGSLPTPPPVRGRGRGGRGWGDRGGGRGMQRERDQYHWNSEHKNSF